MVMDKVRGSTPAVYAVISIRNIRLGHRIFGLALHYNWYHKTS